MNRRIFLLAALAVTLLLLTSVVTAQDGGAVTVMSAWAGSEEIGFRAVLDAFTASTGVEYTYEGDRDVQDTVQTRIAGGNPPDVAIIPRPGVMAQLARDGSLVPLTSGDDPVIRPDFLGENYSQAIIDLGMVDGEFYGLMAKANSKSTVWYRPAEFEEMGLEVPETFDDLVAVTEAFAEAGKTPWSIGGLDGWTLTDWFENIYVRVVGPEEYLALFVDHEVAWTDEGVVEAMELWKQVVAPTDERLAGGAEGTLSTGFQDAFALLLQSEVGLHYEGGFMNAFAEESFPELVCGTDYAFFLFPAVSEEMGAPVVGGGDLAMLINDTPEARQLINFLASEEANTIWATTPEGPVISPNRNVALDAYEHPCKRAEAEQVVNASGFVFDGSDLAPGAVGGDAMFTGLQDFIANPDDIQAVLEGIEEVAADAY
jgi:ABC-type glycerol-3-phosphate transport system substrate-binding protein